ncbi:MAG: myxosortase MrtC [Myxococcota bacterium]
MASRAPVREVAAVYAAVTVATFALTRLRAVPALQEYVHLAVAALFLVVALRLAQREEDGVRRHGMDLAGLLSPPADDRPAGPLGLWDLARAVRAALPVALRETAVALAVAAVVFPPFALGFYLWHRPDTAFTFQPSLHMLNAFVTHLVVVSLPEEAFFRGYVQTRLADAWPRTRRLVGVRLSVPALVWQAVAFGLLHFVVDADPRRLAVVFPGLLFGWLRGWRGGIGAAVVMHAASNVYADLLARGWS